MKKLFFTLMLAVVSLAASAQRNVDMNRSFEVGDKLKYVLLNEKVEQGSLIEMTDGVRWRLVNRSEDGVNLTDFWITSPKGDTIDHKDYKGGRLVLTIDEKGKKAYSVYDSDFVHLYIMEIEPGVWLARTCSVLLDK